jgi:hypothetical protein
LIENLWTEELSPSDPGLCPLLFPTLLLDHNSGSAT